MRALIGQTVVVIGGSSGVGRETARRARGEGADVILTAREPAQLKQPALALGAVGTAAFDASDRAALAGFFDSLARPVEHVVVAAGDPLPDDVARASSGKVTGSLVFLGSTAHSRLIADLALALAPVRVNLVAHRSVVDPADVAAPALRLMIDAALTGATVDVDGGRPLVE